MKESYIEQIYAGWYAKIIGIRLGAPVESWTHADIENAYGEIKGYPVNYRHFAADDDSNGPLFFLRALEDKRGKELTPQDVADALLNYAPFEHGFFWWGGYGVSTEHTAYLNLFHGDKAPYAGSTLRNGATVAEQIGGQIFIDTWGLVNPGNPDRAARMAKTAASVTHDGNGVYGGMFIASIIAAAFEEKNIDRLLDIGLSYIPKDSEYARVVNAVRSFTEANPKSTWRDAYAYVHDHFGYDRYPGNCHIIPNTAVIVLALLYGGGNFSDTINIANNCGWDTDCNTGNVATIMGVIVGLSGIDYDLWRRPISDFLVFSSVIGSMNYMDIPECALYIARLAYLVDGKKMPEPWLTFATVHRTRSHFEFPGSTHALAVRIEEADGKIDGSPRESFLYNTDEDAAIGHRSLKCVFKPVSPGNALRIYKKTNLTSADFEDSRYDPDFSPLAYPGQTVHAMVKIPAYADESLKAAAYAKETARSRIFEGEAVTLKKGEWTEVEYTIPGSSCIIDEVGVTFYVRKKKNMGDAVFVLLDDFYVSGRPHYVIDFSKEREDRWQVNHTTVSQFSRLKGLQYLENGEMHLSTPDFAEVYTGNYRIKDEVVRCFMTPVYGKTHLLLGRVQGALRSYGIGLMPGGKIALLKNDHGYRVLSEARFNWKEGQEYCLELSVIGSKLEGKVDGISLSYDDQDHPYLSGAFGLGIQGGGHARYRRMEIQGY